MHVGHPAKYTKHAPYYITTTSIATPQQQNPQFQEGRLLLLINAYKQSQFPSFWKATSTYNVARTTTQQRVKGIQLKRGSITSNRRLTAAQEKSLKQWILSMDWRGILPRIAIVRQMAGLLAAQRTRPITIQFIGKKWAYNFVKRYNNLQAKFNRKYNY